MGFSLNKMDAMPIPTKRWARVEYERLVDRAVFQPGDRSVDNIKPVLGHDPPCPRVFGRGLTCHSEYPETKATLGDLLGDKMAWMLRAFAG